MILPPLTLSLSSLPSPLLPPSLSSSPPSLPRHPLSLSPSPVFKRYEDSGVNLLLYKLIYIGINFVSLGMVLYKCNSMGLLPTSASDWVTASVRPVRLLFFTLLLAFFLLASFFLSPSLSVSLLVCQPPSPLAPLSPSPSPRTPDSLIYHVRRRNCRVAPFLYRCIFHDPDLNLYNTPFTCNRKNEQTNYPPRNEYRRKVFPEEKYIPKGFR